MEMQQMLELLLVKMDFNLAMVTKREELLLEMMVANQAAQARMEAKMDSSQASLQQGDDGQVKSKNGSHPIRGKSHSRKDDRRVEYPSGKANDPPMNDGD
jgi:hypothetical protein